MEKINISKIRGHWQEQKMDSDGRGVRVVAGGDDTVKSIQLVAEKLNEIIDKLNDPQTCVHNYIPRTYVGQWSASIPAPSMFCTKCGSWN